MFHAVIASATRSNLLRLTVFEEIASSHRNHDPRNDRNKVLSSHPSMTTNQLLALQSNTTLLVKNDPFEYKGRAEITLDGGEIIFWLFSDEAAFVSINPVTDEVVFFRQTESELEGDEEGALFEGEPFELSCKDHGTVSVITDEASLEEEDILDFTDYENKEGEIVRVVENSSTGDSQVYTGIVLVEEETKVVED
ncbi:MAG: hypothetical protein UX09_C0033G0005 [Candidatus Uhrbacteria bacterium GW2011_GWE2_45_35]|uniref:Uncharacterized protein n=2 Tax=Candidatus Uhriibacteriota TaxID=1752732 RepID=A0A0G1LM56_9BACT|nr:MAG: hypothetical protein UW63_C0044G0002 [Candidatus Uhrbacteria bacterium GW2011_GWF2_44_350]KKU07212.1 MAG: hypothetical protein UX09_C0033G0005 [Candidatus Uhrbacteria bacterium GW2011_GWE2_45_35]